MTENVKPKAKKYSKPAPSKNPIKTNKTSKIAPELENVVKIVKYNANIKRHTSLNILNKFVEDGFIDEVKGAFVDFLWNKYTVKSNGVTKEYEYDKTFVEALIKAHSDVCYDSKAAIEKFVKFKNID